jgi:hypothetical protein
MSAEELELAELQEALALSALSAAVVRGTGDEDLQRAIEESLLYQEREQREREQRLKAEREQREREQREREQREREQREREQREREQQEREQREREQREREQREREQREREQREREQRDDDDDPQLLAALAASAAMRGRSVDPEADLDQALKLSRLELSQMTLPQKWSLAAGPATKPFRVLVGIPENLSGLIVGAKYMHTLKIAADAGDDCTIRFVNKVKLREVLAQASSSGGAGANSSPPGTGVACLVIEANSAAAVDAAEAGVNNRINYLLGHPPKPVVCPKPSPAKSSMTSAAAAAAAAPTVTVAQGQLAPAKRRHVFVDNSNIFIGAQSFALPASTMDFTVRLSAVHLANLLDKGAHGANGVASDGGCRIVAGSKPPSKNGVWMAWDRVGYRVRVCGRDPDTGKEDLVDECLIAQMGHAKMQRDAKGDLPGENVLVLVTGDGNRNGGYANFFDTASLFAQNGWRVEIWAWGHTVSGQYKDLVKTHSPSMGGDGRVQLALLDDYESKLRYRAKVPIVAPAVAAAAAAAAAAVGAASAAASVSAHAFAGAGAEAGAGAGVGSGLGTAASVAGAAAEGDSSPSASDDELDDSELCILCLDAKLTHVCVPCGHRVLCDSCNALETFTECPFCRKPCQQMMKFY